jgi:hypothetical protein
MSDFSENIGDLSDVIGGYGRTTKRDDTTRNAEIMTPAQKAFERDRAMRRKIDRLFSTKNGQEVLAWLVSITLDRSVIPFDTLGVWSRDQRMTYADHREGENELVRAIILTLKANRKGESDDET